MNTLDVVQESGVISKIIFNKDNYMIGILKNKNNTEITFKGEIFGLSKGDEINFHGSWTEHFKYGKQLVVSRWERPLPNTKEKIIAFLSSPFIKGCGEKQALNIVEKLGDKTIERILSEKEKALLGIKGIGKKKAILISQSVSESYGLQRIIAELSTFGIRPQLIIKTYQKYGEETLDLLTKNPYLLCKEKLLSFPDTDEIAMRMMISATSGYRVEACVQHILNNTCYTSGHCYMQEEELIQQVVFLLNQNKNVKEKADTEDVKQAIYNLEEKAIIIEQGNVYPKDLWVYETKLAKKIHTFIKRNKKKKVNNKIDSYIKDYQKRVGIILGEEQKEAIKTVLNNNITVITGSAGTGKTTVVKAIVDIYQKINSKSTISLSAPTGRASRKLEEITGQPSQTNHKLLGYNPKEGQNPFEYHEDNKLDYDFYIIDEMSMVDLHMSYALLSAISYNAKVLLIGDVSQLPSINAGNVLKDLLDTKGVPVARLTQIYRQAQTSQIISNSNRVNQGKPVQVDHSQGDMYFLNKQDNRDIANTIIKSVTRFLDLGYDVSDILVLSPMKKGDIGTFELNARLQEVVNPKEIGKNEVVYRKRTFRVGDKIMQTVNREDLGISNGDIGIITFIGKVKVRNDNDDLVEVEVIKSNFNGNKVTHEKDDWKELELGYSISIHKSQGGQAPIVIIPMSMSHYIMLARNLIYTAMTRAEDILVLIGQDTALNTAINNNRISIRHTQLKQRITALMASDDYIKKHASL